jgi:hypothetical protein
MAPPFLTSTIHGSEWSASCLDHFTLVERSFCFYWLGDWMGSGQCLEAVEKRKIVCLYQESNPGQAVLNPSLYRLGYPKFVLIYLLIIK